MIDCLSTDLMNEELLVQCPYCAVEVNELWRGLTASHVDNERMKDENGAYVRIWFMHCPNRKCRKLVIKAVTSKQELVDGVALQAIKEEWIVLPKKFTRHVDPAVDPPYSDDFCEAAAILPLSPRMSAVLSRRILADLLEEFAGKTQFGLVDRIDSFNQGTNHPYQLRKNLQYLREIADLSAHTKKDDQAVIVNVGYEEAAWTLDVIERLFDYFIVTPKHDAKMRESVEELRQRAGRRDIKPLPEDIAGNHLG